MSQTTRSKRIQKILTVPILLVLFFLAAQLNTQYHMANLTNVSVTSSNPRPSFRGALGAGNTSGSTIVTINGTANAYPSTSSAQFVEGDTVRIGQGGSLASYTIASTSSQTVFTTTTALSGTPTAGHDVISSQSANLAVRFTTVNAINNGKFRVLVPALADNTAAADGIPDGGAFDFGAATVTCPGNTTGYTFAAGTGAASSVTVGNTDYHVFECGYTGAGAVGTQFGSTTTPITISGLINPAPKANHTNGTADSYNVIVQHLDASNNVVDQTAVSIAVIEAVRVTATVPPQLTFRVIGQASGYGACGTVAHVSTTATAVPFGEVSISDFTDAVQTLTVSTNAANGFVVTAQQNDQLGRNGQACPGNPTITSDLNCIADTIGAGTSTHLVASSWVSQASKGFGYSLHDKNNSTNEAFAHGGSFNAKQFASAEESEAAQTIFSATTPADNHNVDVCYRVIVGATTAAGNYENNIVYNATATF